MEFSIVSLNSHMDSQEYSYLLLNNDILPNLEKALSLLIKKFSNTLSIQFEMQRDPEGYENFYVKVNSSSELGYNLLEEFIEENSDLLFIDLKNKVTFIYV